MYLTTCAPSWAACIPLLHELHIGFTCAFEGCLDCMYALLLALAWLCVWGQFTPCTYLHVRPLGLHVTCIPLLRERYIGFMCAVEGCPDCMYALHGYVYAASLLHVLNYMCAFLGCMYFLIA